MKARVEPKAATKRATITDKIDALFETYAEHGRVIFSGIEKL